MAVTAGAWGIDGTDVVVTSPPDFDDKSAAQIVYPLGRGPVALDPVQDVTTTSLSVSATGADIATVAPLVATGAHVLTLPDTTAYDIFITSSARVVRSDYVSWTCAVTLLGVYVAPDPPPDDPPPDDPPPGD